MDTNRKKLVLGETKWPWAWLIRSLGVGALVVFLFQNCSDPLNLGDGRNGSLNSSLPFAYDVVLDQLSYMSCSGFEGRTPPAGAYFSVRAGGYFQGSGIRLSDEYIAATKNYSAQKRLDALAGSTANQGAEMQMAFREVANYQNIWTSSAASGSAREGDDYINLLGKLDGLIVGKSLVGLTGTDRLQFFDFIEGVGAGRLLEGSMSALDNEATAGSLRTRLNDDEIMLAMTFTDELSGSPVWARGPFRILDGAKPNSTSSVYGKGYRLSFGAGFGIRSTVGVPVAPTISHGGNNRRLREVRELDLLDSKNSTLGRWECPPDHSFVIIREKDNNKAGISCNTGSEVSYYQDPVYQKVREVLHYEDWWVDMGQRCIVAKSSAGGCYIQDDQDEFKVAYDGSACTLNLEVNPADKEKFLDLCPHQFNLCVLK